MSNIWYGSLNNRLAEHAQQPTPVVGMGVTECCYSDRHPWEIIEVKDEKHITIRQMGCERIDKNGMSDCQEYRYFSKPDGGVKHLVLRNGRWRDRNAEGPFEADCLLYEEVAEATEAWLQRDKEHCLEELAQCGAVILRMMEFVEKEK